MDGLSPETRGFVDAEPREIGNERRRLQYRLEELQSAPCEPIDPEAVLREGLASLRDLPRLPETGSLEERKEFVRAVVGGVEVIPEEARLEIEMRKIPAMGLPRPGNSACGLVAGARYERVRIELEPVEKVAGRHRMVRSVA